MSIVNSLWEEGVFYSSPEVGRIDLSYDETCVVPGWGRESSEQAQHNHHKQFRVDDIEEKH